MPIQRTWKVCPAKGCGKRHQRLLKLCGTHERHHARNGHPEARRVQRHELNPYRPAVAIMLDRWCDHEAVVAAHKTMDEILCRFGLDEGRASTGRRARPPLDALIRAGADAHSCLIEMAALAFYYQSKRDWPDEKVQVMAFANRLLLSVPGAGNSKNAYARRVVAGLGYRIIEKLRGFLLEMWAVHERTLAAASERQKVMHSFSQVDV
jgi:hypothetical protein